MSDTAREWAERARKAQEAVSELGAGPPAGRIAGTDGPLVTRARELAAALGLWATRDDTRPQPEIRRAAGTAMHEIDAMLRELHALRAQLVSEIRAADDATAARVDAMLARAGPAGAQVTEGNDD